LAWVLKDEEAPIGVGNFLRAFLELASLAANQLKYSHDGEYNRRNC
jgi:hypothetical protein